MVWQCNCMFFDVVLLSMIFFYISILKKNITINNTTSKNIQLCCQTIFYDRPIAYTLTSTFRASLLLLHNFKGFCNPYNFTQLYIDARPDLIPTILRLCIIVLFYLWFYIEPDDVYILQNHLTVLHIRSSCVQTVILPLYYICVISNYISRLHVCETSKPPSLEHSF